MPEVHEKQNSKITGKMIANLQNLSTALVDRQRIVSQLGKSYGTDGDDRNLYEALGYPLNLTYNHFESKYIRQDIAKRIINAYPDATWSYPPRVYETEDVKQKTPFETSWESLMKGIRVFHYLMRADKVSGIGQYGAVLLGFDDGKPYASPAKNATRLLYMQPYGQNKANIHALDEDTSSERYGLPEVYSIKVKDSAPELLVHHSRVLHMAEERTTSDVYGTPRLECVYNRLMNLELLSGGSAEMFWRGAFPGYSFEMPEDVSLTTDEKSAMADEIEEYFHTMKRYLRLQGVNAKELAPQAVSPKEHIAVQTMLIAGATGIPMRILTGSERGELASAQDEGNWERRVDERRHNYAEPSVLRPFIDIMINAGVLKPPKDGYSIRWPNVETMNAKELADVASVKSEAIRRYGSTPGAEFIVPVEHFRTKVLGFSIEESEEMDKVTKGLIRDEELDTIEEDNREVKEEDTKEDKK